MAKDSPGLVFIATGYGILKSNDYGETWTNIELIPPEKKTDVNSVAVNSGTAALHAALISHGVGEGDEVITTPFSFIATANTVLYTGAKPVFADIQEDTLNIDPEDLRQKLTPRTKAIYPVQLAWG